MPRAVRDVWVVWAVWDVVEVPMRENEKVVRLFGNLGDQPMTHERAINALELKSETPTTEDVEQAFRRLRKKHDPSTFSEPNNKADAERRFAEITKAAEFLMHSEATVPTDLSHPDADEVIGGSVKPQPGSSDYRALRDFVLNFLDREAVVYRYDGTLSWRQDADPARDLEAGDLEELAAREPLTRDRLLNIVMHECGLNGLKPQVGLIRVILTDWRFKQRQNRRRMLWRTVADPVSPVEQQTVEDAVLRMADARFDEDPDYVLAGLIEVVWQIKCKWTTQRVEEPLVTVLTSETQLTGKSELARRLVSPIREMTRDNIKIEDILDKRNRELLEAYGIIIDDADRTAPDKRGRFKAFVTAAEHNNRVLFTGLMEKSCNNSTIIVTANLRLTHLFGDPTGMRRFMELRLKEHRITPGQKALTDVIDWTLFWRLIDPRDPSPLAERGWTEHLLARQIEATPRDPKDVVADWARDFDPYNPAYRAHLDNQERITAGDLFQYCFEPYEIAMFGRNATNRDKWGKALGKLIRDGAAPFMREDGRITTLYTFTRR